MAHSPQPPPMSDTGIRVNSVSNTGILIHPVRVPVTSNLGILIHQGQVCVTLFWLSFQSLFLKCISMFRSFHFSFLVFGLFWQRSYANTKIYVIFVYILQGYGINEI